MSTTVLIPWRPGCPYRSSALSWVLQRYWAHGWDAKTCEASYERSGTDSGEAWCKAAAVNPAIERSEADIVVVADADCWTAGLADAVADVERGASWAIPHAGVFRLTAGATAQVLTGEEPHEDLELERRAYKGFEGGGIVVGRREVLLDAPLDKRFRGWGQEDDSWGIALRCLAGVPARGRRPPLYHLHHPPPERMNLRFGSPAGKRLRARYIAARENPARMRALIEEGRR